MKEIVHAPNRFGRYAAGLTLSALALALLAAAFASGPAQAQNPPATNGIPEPCGPGAVLHSGLANYSLTRYSPATETISVYATYVPSGGDPETDTRRVDSHNSVTIIWTQE